MYTLLASSLLGIVWLSVIFLLCFAGVHVLRLARLGQVYRKSQSQDDAPVQSAPPPPKEKESEPVYYIVERKRRKKPSLGEPKRIRFSLNDHNNQP